MAITTLPAPCWFIATADGQPYDNGGDAYPHFTTETEARAGIGMYYGEVGQPLTTAAHNTPCVEVLCDAGCRTPHHEDRDTGSTTHFPDTALARSAVGPDGWGDDWILGDDDTTWHAECAPARAEAA